MEFETFFKQLNKMEKKSYIKIGTGIATAATLFACTILNKKGFIDLTPTALDKNPKPSENLKPIEGIEIPKAETIAKADAELLIEYINGSENSLMFDLKAENVTGAYFGDGTLFHIKDIDGADYYLLNQGSNLNPKTLNWEVNGNELSLVPQANEGDLYSGLKYFIWTPETADAEGNIIITYQPDGTSDTAQNFILSSENQINQVLKANASIILDENIVNEGESTQKIIEGAQEFLGDGFEITSEGVIIDKTLGVEIPGIKVMPFDKETMIINKSKPSDPDPIWVLERKYKFEDQENFTIYLTEYDTKVLEESGLDMYGWIYENGEFKKQVKEFDAPNGGKVEIEIYNTLEAEYMITKDSSENPAHRVDSFRNIRNMTDDVLKIKSERGSDQQWKLYITCLGMYQEVAEGNYWATNIVPIANSDGTIDLIETTEYVVKPFKDRSLAAVGWYDSNDKPKVVIVESATGLDIPYIFNIYWKNNPIEDTFDK